MKGLQVGLRLMGINNEDAQSGMGSERGAGKQWDVSLLFKKVQKMGIFVFSTETLKCVSLILCSF